ncbi:MAG TPA: sulfur carrier protein ThiS [Bryobacteraceae bacterium]|jgi:sulfur carrier protein|nr:sulfur carrier protein ThiS [Bryobacteraceae bacterium]
MTERTSVSTQAQAEQKAAQSITVVVNGEVRQFPAPQTVATLLESLGIPDDRVAVEMNKSIVRKRDWAETPAPNGAQIEIVQFVGGG